MQKRNIRIQFWINKKELEKFERFIKKSKLSKTAYLRHVIKGLIPQNAPPPDYYSMMKELHSIGNKLYQSNPEGENYRLIEKTILKITDEIIRPRKAENGYNFNLES